MRVEQDRTIYGEEVKFGGGKVIRDGMGQSQRGDAEAVDTIITNALIIDHWGIVKADIGLKHGRIHAIGKGGNPDVQPGVSIVIGPGTEVIAGEGLIAVPGGIPREPRIEAHGSEHGEHHHGAEVHRPRARQDGGHHVELHEGHEGHAFLGSAQRGAHMDGESLIQFLKPVVMSQNPLDRERLYQGLWQRNRATTYRAIGAVDIALWDIAGKVAGQPIHRLLGSYATASRPTRARPCWR